MVLVFQLQKPEQIRAAAVLQKSIPSLSTLFTCELDTRNMFPSNYRTFCSYVSTLPHGDNWLWNQSNAKVKINLPECEATMQKMNTRRKKNGPKAPFYKIWLFSIVWNVEREDMQFIWCERGLEPPKLIGEKKLEFPSPLPNQTVRVKAEPTNVKVEPGRVDPVKADPVKVEPVKVEPVKADPVKVEPVKLELGRVEPAKVELGRVEPVWFPFYSELPAFSTHTTMFPQSTEWDCITFDTLFKSPHRKEWQ